MMTYIPLRKRRKLVGTVRKFTYDFPCPSNLNYAWNFGSLLGVTMILQLATGFLLRLHYAPVAGLAFERVAHIERDVRRGWLLRSIHQNGARALIGASVIHIGRGVYYDSYDRTPGVWYVGSMLYILSIAARFLGYVLPWGQMSY